MECTWEYYDFGARANYERIIFQQSHLNFQGLYYSNDNYYAVCEGYSEETLAADGSLLSKWFENHRVICCPISLVAAIPLGAILVPHRSLEERSLLHGEPHTVHDIKYELQLSLPRDFPKFTVKSPDRSIVVITERSLTDDEKNIVYITCANIGSIANIEFSVEKIDDAKEKETLNIITRIDTLELKTSRSLSHYDNITNEVKKLVSDDEEFWIDNRYDLLSKPNYSNDQILPTPFRSKNKACFISSNQLSSQNLRVYLTLYQRVIIDFPLAENFENVLKKMCVTEKELFELARRGRVQFVFSLSIDRYDHQQISYLSDNIPYSLLFPRRLAAATILEVRKRLPILIPPFSIGEQAEFLNFLKSIEDKEPHLPIKPIRIALGNAWIGAVSGIQSRGAVGIAPHGIGMILAEVGKTFTRKDLSLEFLFASMGVEWSMALGATYFPVQIGKYSDQRLAEMCAALYSGICAPKTGIQSIPNLESIIQNLLAINNDMPILDLEELFNESVTDTFLTLIEKINSEKELAEAINEKVIKINSEVTQYEKRKNKLISLDIAGLVAAVSAVTPKLYMVPVAMWALNNIILKSDKSFGILGDTIRAMVTLTPRDAVFVSRIKSQLTQSS